MTNPIPENQTNCQLKSHHTSKTKESLVARINRLEGQMRGIKRMIEEDTYCDEVLNQISSAQSCLSSLGNLLLEHHLKSCVVEQIEAGHKEVVDELLKTIKKLTK